jgi:cyclase
MREYPELMEVADGIYGYIQGSGGWCVNNAGIITSAGNAALVDTAATEIRAKRLKDCVHDVTGVDPFAVVNTHSHGDHTFGNCVFKDSTIIGHHQTRMEVVGAGLHLTELWPTVHWGSLEITPPNVTYANEMTVHIGDIRADLLHMGVAHSTNDTIVWLPTERVVFTGDVVMSGVTPFCPLGSVRGTLAAIERIRTLDPLTVITGHGPVGGVDLLDVAEQYMLSVQTWAKQGIAEGIGPLELSQNIDLGEHAGLLESERLVANLHRAYSEEVSTTFSDKLEMRAAIAEMGTIFGEMVAFNKGPLTCHA